MTIAEVSHGAKISDNLQRLLDSFKSDSTSKYPVTVQKAVYLAQILQDRAATLQSKQERRQQAELDKMIQNPEDKVTLTKLTDQAFRSNSPHRSVEQMIYILDVQGIPRYFSAVDKALLKGFQSFGGYLPGVAAPMVKDKMRQETANVILPAEKEHLARHLRNRREIGIRMNVNHLGEALLGESEAQNRLKTYLQTLQMPEIEVISVKISTIYSQIWPIARQHTVNELCDRMELLYRAAAKSTFTRADGTVVPKFVYLDMEEYRDMAITSEVFMKTLDRPGMENIKAGIVLQAYIPDSYRVQKELLAWAKERVANGGAPLMMRIVKGANMEMERVEASIRDWPQAPYKRKIDTDANYKRMLHEGLKKENLNAIHLGMASHNLFELSYSLVMAVENNALDRVHFEMLEGMASHQRRALYEMTNNMLLYAPACKKEDFIHAIGYLIRRLDENTGPENFLRYAFKVSVGSSDWKKMEKLFLDSFDLVETVYEEPRRTQNRQLPIEQPDTAKMRWEEFINEPDTDFSLEKNIEWAHELAKIWKPRSNETAVEVPVVIAGEVIRSDRKMRESLDPSRPNTVVARFCQANSDDINKAVACAKADDDQWRQKSPAERHEILRGVAQEIRLGRGDLMGAAMAEGGKIFTESDPEVSEAIDFVEFYAQTANYFFEQEGFSAKGKGVVAVVPPWNFPIAIPCGGIAAALAAGNTVILKPASDTVMTAYFLCECFWRAGVSKKVLQFAPCSGAREGQQLVTDDGVDVVILTGGTETALTMLAAKPEMNLLAETGGKNATIVTAMADRDLAIKNIIQSAFNHAGQKCSATSLLILEEEVYNDPEFKRALCDAVASLKVGSAWDFQNKVGPMVNRPSGDLEKALKELEMGESWAVFPKKLEGNPSIYSPGVKWDVTPGSYTHMTEFFGPVLGVLKARNLEEAIQFVNQTGFGLTSGLESLDDREQEIWQKSIKAGNLYINRPTTGAIVLRQPFGGMGKSAFGPGIKAGGPNYVAQLMDFTETDLPEKSDQISDSLVANLLAKIRGDKEAEGLFGDGEKDRLFAAVASYDRNMAEEFSRQHDHFKLIGQDNFRRYLPVGHLRIRLTKKDTAFDVFARVCAAKIAGCRMTVSYPSEVASKPIVEVLERLTQDWAASIEFVEESDEQLAEVIRHEQTDRIRYADSDRVPAMIREEIAKTVLYIADAPVLSHGRLELVWYVQEQSVCVDYHRYGNLGSRADEDRHEPE
ncbi:MAG: bifunctional proline dehydrogenase/L-glutamate gamma-semialdehyde dehydrogenase [Pirellulaceae bacterium]|nr:bifunctional proline dehydrogenase/L-glutamate gamma-semialdehyde dehydrogenase [Pirellulaceae bacterium]